MLELSVYQRLNDESAAILEPFRKTRRAYAAATISSQTGRRAFSAASALPQRTPGIPQYANLCLIGGYPFPPREGFPAWGYKMDWNVQVEIRSAQVALERARALPVPLSVTVETSLGQADLQVLRRSGPLAQLIARQAEAFARDEGIERHHRQTCVGLLDDTINFLQDPLACAIGLGWHDGVETAGAPLVAEIEEGWLHQRVEHDGRPTHIVARVDGPKFGALWLRTITAA